MGSDRDTRAHAPSDLTGQSAAQGTDPREWSPDWQPTVAQILDAMPHPVFWKDGQGVYQGCNDVFAQVAGLRSAADVVGKTDFDLPWTRAEAEAYRADDRQVIDSRQPRRHIVEPLQRADGTRRWIDTTKVPLLAADGRPCGVLGVFNDITERRHAEETARQERHFSESAIEAMPGVFFMFDEHGRFLKWNRNLEALSGYTAEEIAQRTIFDLLRPDCWELVTQRVQEVFSKGWAVAEVVLVSKDGRETPFYCHSRRTMLDGRPYVLGMGIDISERKCAEAELERTRLLLEAVVEQSPVPMTMVHTQGQQIGLANRVAREFLGKTDEPDHKGLSLADALRVQSWRDILPDGTPTPPEALPLRRTLRGEKFTNEEYGVVRKDGSVRWASVSGTPVYDRNGALIGGLIVYPDITERKQAEEQQRLRQAEWRRQNELLLQLMMRGTLFRGELDTALAEITAAGAELLQTERVGVWWYEDDCQVLRCADAYTRSTAAHSSGETLRSADFPSCHASHREGRVIAAVDVRTDPRTCEIPAAYWDAHDIHSLMHAPVRLHGQLGAVVCFEHVGTPRQWTSDDEHVATTLATLVSLCVESAERRRSESALRDNEMKYRALFEAAGDAAFVLRMDGDDPRVMESNQRAQELFAATRAQLDGATISDISALVQPDGTPSREAARSHSQRALAGETPHFEWRHRRLDGTEFDADVVLTCVPIGAERQLVGIIRDITRRKQAEASLIKRERLLDNIIEQNPYPIWISDAHGTLLRVNRACCDMLGVHDTDVVNRYNILADRIVQEQGILAPIESVFAEGRTAHVIYNYDMGRWQLGRHGAAKELVLESTIAPVRDENGTITNAVFMHNDITQRVRAENELRDSERKYRALSQEFQTILEAIPGSLVLIAPDFKIVWANEYTKNTSLGIESGEMLGQYCYRCRHDLSEPCEACPVQRCFASGKPESGERDTPNGKIWELHAAPVLGDRGEIKGVIEVAYDVTNFRQADRELKASEARLRTLFQAAPIGILFGKDRITLSVNDALCDLLGYSQAELIGQSSRLVYFTQEEFEEVGRRVYGPAMVSGHSTFEARLRRKDGNSVDVLLNGAPLRPEDPTAGFVVTIQDITQRRRAEEELQKLAAVVRHSSELVNLATLDGRMVFVNDAGGRMLGIDPQTVEQHHVLEAIPAEWLPLAQQVIMPALASGQTWEGELQYRNLQTGHLTDVHATTFAINDPTSGRPAYFVNVSRDITERKRAEMELLREKQFTEKLLESLPGIFFLYDSTCHLKRWNKAHETAMGFTADELRDWYIPNWHEAPEDAAVGMALVKSVLETGVGGAFETTLINKAGHFVPYVISITRLMTPDGPAMMGVGIDITERKRAERSLQESEANLRAILASTDDIIASYDRDLRLVVYNAACRDAYRRLFSVEVYPGLRTLELFPEAQRGFWAANNARALAGETFSAEFSLPAADGELRFFESFFNPTCSGDAITGFSTFTRDITERKRAEMELLREKQFTEKLLESLPGIFFLYDSTCHLKRWNKAHETATGFTADELRDWYIPNWHETPEDAAVGMALVKSVLETGVGGAFETTLINKAGHFVPYVISITRLMTPGGPVMMGIGIDITARRQMEEERKRLTAVLDSTSDVVVMYYPGGGLFYLNAAGRRLLEWDETAALDARDFRELYPTWAYDLLRDEAVPAVNQTGFWHGETAILSAGGREIPVSQLLMAHRAADGHVEHYSSIMRDITERKRAEEARARLEAQLHQSQKMEAIGQLAGGVAHDFNNILTAVFGQLDLSVHALETQFPAARSLLDGMHEIERSAHRASALTRQLLAFSRRQVTRPEVLSLNATLCDLEKMLRRLLTENIVFEQILATDLAATKADAGQLEQVIVNLVVNARDAMPSGGRLTLETRNVVLDDSYVALHPGTQAGEHVVLTVSDTGQGMDQATLEHIFEPFFTTKPTGQGTGLGLSTVYGIVRQAGGHVTVYSEPGRGATFKVYLPAVRESVAVAKPTLADAESPGGTETLIVCEDDAAVRELTARMLVAAGYHVLVAPDGVHALELAAQHAGPLELLITDVIMPDMNGRQLAEALGGVRPGVRTLFVSGYTSNVIAHHGVLDESVNFLEKPYSRRQLLQKIREVLDRAPPAEPRRSGV